MKTSFTATKNNIATRNFGGKHGVADPYVTGYHFIHFEGLPDGLPGFTIGTPAGKLEKDDITKILSGTCLSVTPPGGTLNKIEFTGLGGVKWAVPGNIDYGNSVSIKFVEMQGLPIASIMHAWIKMMRDYRTGLSIEDTNTDGYTKKTYASLLYYWTTAPDAKTVEYYACYDGVFPTKDPQDLFTSDVETVGKLEVEIEFNCDYIWHEEWVKNKIENTFIGDVTASVEAVKNYGEDQSA